jgi:phage FluMu gp28-like protein
MAYTIRPEEIPELKRRALENPGILVGLGDDTQAAVAQAIIDSNDRRYVEDPYVWAVEQVTTIDETVNELRPFPDKMYLHDYFDALRTEKKLVVPKSRRMVVTWATAIFLLNRIRYLKHYVGYVQSEIESKAAYVIDKRMKFVEDNLSPLYRRAYRSIHTKDGLVGQMTFAQTGSWAKALAQGSDAFRTYTPSFIFMDEIEFMDKGHQSFVAALPFIEGAAQMVLVSTSNGPHGVIADMARNAGFQRFR